jgi:predicted NUDIX family NTP pyrophosphohydrolase
MRDRMASALGRRLKIPEVDRGRWFLINVADEYIREEQRELLRRLSESAPG